MAEPLPEISREQADLLLRQLHAALGTPRAGDRVRHPRLAQATRRVTEGDGSCFSKTFSALSQYVWSSLAGQQSGVFG